MSNRDDLIAQRDAAARAYYDGEAVMSDEQFDELTEKLEALGVEQIVGHGYIPTEQKIAHLRPMLSLQKVKTLGEIEWFVDRIGDRDNLFFEMQYKYDGQAASLRYNDQGNLEVALTRGGGGYGENITPVVLEMIKNQRLPRKARPNSEVRGELILLTEDFIKLNAEQITNDLEPYQSARNTVPGLTRRTDVTQGGRFLSFYVYDVIGDSIDAAAADGFDIAPTRHVTGMAGIAPIIEEITEERQSGSIPFEIDGIVIKVGNQGVRDELGNSSSHPNWAVAYKFPNEYKSTVLRDIEWRTGRTGRIVPTGVFDPVYMDEGNLSRVTLNNLEYLTNLDVRLGDNILITRSGGVIPFISGRDGDHTLDSIRWFHPSFCPNCNEPVEVYGADIVCPTRGGCSVVRTIVYGLDTLNVLGVSGALVRGLRDNGHKVDDLLDLLAVKFDTIRYLPGFGFTSAQKAVAAMEVVWDRSVAAWLAAIGIPGVAYSTATTLVERYGTLDAIAEATIDELVQLPKIGWGKAEMILAGSDKIKMWANRLRDEFGFEPKPLERAEPAGDLFAGESVVVTGTFPTMKRPEVENAVRDNGGIIQGSVSSKTTLLIAGEKAGSKLAKAESLGIRVMSGEEFETAIAGSN